MKYGPTIRQRQLGVALALNSLGLTSEFRGDDDSALKYYASCLSLARVHGERGAESVVLLNLASVYGITGKHEEALVAVERSLAIRRDQADPVELGQVFAVWPSSTA